MEYFNAESLTACFKETCGCEAEPYDEEVYQTYVKMVENQARVASLQANQLRNQRNSSIIDSSKS